MRVFNIVFFIIGVFFGAIQLGAANCNFIRSQSHWVRVQVRDTHPGLMGTRITFVRRKDLPAPLTPQDVIPRILEIMRSPRRYMEDHAATRLFSRELLEPQDVRDAANRVVQIYYQPTLKRFRVTSLLPGSEANLVTVIELDRITGSGDVIITFFTEDRAQYQLRRRAS